MKRNPAWTLALLFLLAVGWLALRWTRPAPASGHRVDLNVGGPAGRSFRAGLLVDGASNSFGGLTPTNLVFQAAELAYLVEAGSNAPGLRVTLYVDNLPRISTLAGAGGGVRGHWRLAADGERVNAMGF